MRIGIAIALLMFVPAAQAEWVLREQAIMGTRCAVELWVEDPATAPALAEKVFEEMRRVDRLMSTYKPQSQLSRLNAEGARRPVVLAPELYRLIADSLRYSQLSGGAFDVTYASVGYLYDYRQHQRPDVAAISAALPGINYRHVQLLPKSHAVRFTRTGTRVDLGGIAKGYAVDRGIEVLRAAGITRAMVNAGGDTRIIGDRFGKPWMVGIRDPNNADAAALRIPLSDAAISTSGDYERFFDEGGVRYHHIINPRTGDSARLLRSATVIGPDATRTDALSTTVFVMGPQAGIELINSLDDVDAIVVTPEGRVLYSKGLAPP
jgi:thiamine biosynthesis lipoprotein